MNNHLLEDNDVDLEINSENLDSHQLNMNNRDSLGFDRKVKDKESEMNRNNGSPLLDKESFRQIKQDHDKHTMNLNEKAMLFNNENRKMQNGTPLRFIATDAYGNLILNKESTIVIILKLMINYLSIL